MMNSDEYRSRAVAARARAADLPEGFARAEHLADSRSWDSLAKMADGHEIAMAAFKI